MASIAWLINVSTNKTYELRADDTRIGRTNDNDIVLTDKSVSRSHALIRRKNGIYLLFDLGASVAIKVNNVTVTEPHQLYAQDEIQIGKILFRFVSSK